MRREAADIVSPARDTVNVNLKSVFLCAREAYRYMKEQGGVIINAASYAAVIASAGSGAYAASKSAVYSLTKTLAAELAPYHIRVNGFIPGVIKTGMTQGVVEQKGDELVGAIALHRLGAPVDVANAVAFLASEEASYLTGTFIEISGGKLFFVSVTVQMIGVRIEDDRRIRMQMQLKTRFWPAWLTSLLKDAR